MHSSLLITPSISLDIVSAHPPSQLVTAGQDVILRCVIHDNTRGSVICGWLHDGMTILATSHYIISPDGEMLTIVNVQSSDVGAYCCMLCNDVYSNTSTLRICGKCIPVVCLLANCMCQVVVQSPLFV